MIYCVVLGHLTYNDYGIGLVKIIYSFHMPVFIFLSGYFTSLTSSKTKQTDWFMKTFLIYVFAQFVHVFLELLIGKKIGFSVLVSPRFALWYLVCLIYWRFAIWRVFNKTSDKSLFLLSAILAIVSGIIPIGHALSFQRTFAFFPFFVLGIITKRQNLMNKIQGINTYLAITIIIICLSVSRYLPLYQPKQFYEGWNDVLMRVVQTIMGILLCISIIKITKTAECVKSVAKYGLFTLWIYVGHTYFIVLERNVFCKFWSYDILVALLLSAMYCAFFIMLAKIYKITFRH